MAASGKTLTVVGGNLFIIAAQQLGDATQWERIASLNPQLGGDPQIVGKVTLKLPQVLNPALYTGGGILGRQ